MKYPERVIDKELDELLPELPAIALDGPTEGGGQDRDLPVTAPLLVPSC